MPIPHSWWEGREVGMEEQEEREVGWKVGGGNVKKTGCFPSSTVPVPDPYHLLEFFPKSSVLRREEEVVGEKE